MQILETVEYQNHIIKVIVDEQPESPREWCNLGTIVCWNTRYDLGDKHDFSSPREFLISLIDLNEDIDIDNFTIEDLFNEASKTNVILPLNIGDYGSGEITIYLDEFEIFLCDGFTYVSHTDILKHYDIAVINNEHIKQVTNVLKSEIKTYNNYLSGNVLGFQIYDNENESEIDSLWGFYDEVEEVISYAKEEIDILVNEPALDKLFNLLKTSPINNYLTIKLNNKLLIIEDNSQKDIVASITYLFDISEYKLEYPFASNTLFFHFSKPADIINALNMLNYNLYEIVDFNV